MHVSTVAPLAVASFVWQPRAAAFVLTVICKATYELRNGVSPLVMTPSAPLPTDLYWEENPLGSLHTPTDFVPFKRRVDVLLGGHAYAPQGQASDFLVARLAIGTVNKAIAVNGDRHWMRDGSLSEPVPFTKMPLRWERSAGGPTTWNPVGVPTSGQAQWRRFWPAPNLEPLGFRLESPTQLGQPIGFGALAPHWPTRAEHLSHHAPGWTHDKWYERPLPSDVDAAYFNVAPADQQIEKLPPQAKIVLVHLHPKISPLVTVLEDICPIAVVTRSGAAPQEIGLRCDTLLFDTDRGTCTLTYRASVPLAHPQEDVVVLVNPTRAGASASPAPRGLEPPVTTTDTIPTIEARAAELAPRSTSRLGTRTLVPGLTSATSPTPQGPVLPFKSANPETTPAQALRALSDNRNRSKTLVPGVTSAAPQRPRRSTLPFVGQDPKMAPTPEASAKQPTPIAPDGDEWPTLPPRDVPRMHALPFAAPSPTTAPPLDSRGRRSAARASKGFGTGTLIDVPIPPTAAPLPFQTASSPETPHHEPMPPSQLTPSQSPSQSELEPDIQRRPLIEAGSLSQQTTQASSMQPFFGTSLSAAAPLATEASGGFGQVTAERAEIAPAKAPLSLEQYARIKMQLWGAHASLSDVLERHGIDEVEWRIHERRQADALADEGRAGRCDLALALMAALEASQGQPGGAGLAL